MLFAAYRRLSALRKRFLGKPVPLYTDFGFARGWPVDRYYIEGFLKANSADIRGDVLEAAANPNYTKQFGGDRVTRGHIMYPVPGLPGGTMVGNLETGEGIPDEAFDCIILTQVLQFIYDMPAAVRHSYRALKPGGTMLATFAGISQVSREDMDSWGEYWRVTDAAARRLFGDVFGADNVTAEPHGNVLAACAFLNGLVITDMKPEDLAYHDPDYQVIVTVRAVKPAS
ncbi:class I SAM-dependent methyltransferase [Sandaracinobacteroides sp. A072]|uniref:class I SAM-dependent methyltransferase n=1 Tax=Sandaracinobacteroides sp. A072 TaxID=3461146 RepID=UPI004041007F